MSLPDDPPSIVHGLRSLREPTSARLLRGVLAQIGVAEAYARVETAFGPLLVAWNDHGISATAPAGETPAEARTRAEEFQRSLAARRGRRVVLVDRLPASLERALQRRLAEGGRVELDVDLSDRTSFERAVLEKALEIPRGEVRPYGWIAKEIGRPRAVRAVGSALARNPVPLVLPCHRVVRTDGRVGDYAWGTPAKVAFLADEGVDTRELERLASRGIRYLGSDTTGIYCLPTCRNARRISDAHRVPLASAREAAEHGMRPCKVCRPVPAEAA